MTGQTSPAQQNGRDGGGCPAGGFGRRSFLHGAAATGFAATAVGNRPWYAANRRELTDLFRTLTA